MNEIFETYKERMDFFLVYIREAHPSDGWQVRSNLDDHVEFLEPTTDDERAQLAGTCMLDLGFTMPALLDNMQNEVDAKYAALPERLYVLDAAGKVFFRGIMGSRGFDVDTWLEAVQAQAALSGAQAAE
jgi:hypothetical protein